MNRYRLKTIATIVWLVIAGSAGAQAQVTADLLEKGFANPPHAAKPWTYWDWLHSNLTREGITADLEDMKRIGLGGVLIMDIAECAPKGLTCLSPEWWSMVDYTFREANRLGLEVNFMNSPSWSGSSGPWVKPEQAMKVVVSSETEVAGPARGKLTLPHPPVISVPIDRDGRPREIIRFYRDIAVLAFPTPAVETTPFSQWVAAIRTGDGKAVARPEDLLDHNPDTFLALPAAAKPYLQFELKEPLAVRGVTLKLLRPNAAVRKIEVQASQDGKAFGKVCLFPPEKHRLGVISRNANPYTERSDIRFDPVCARFLRIVFDVAGGADNPVTVGDVEFHQGVRITDLASKAGYIRNAGSPFDPQETPLEPGMAIGPKEVVDLTDRLKADGRLDWNVPAGRWTILRFGCTVINSTGQEAPLAARGLNSDMYSREASEMVWSHGQLKKLIDTAGPLCGKTLTAAHIDSYEEDCHNWTPKLREEFTRRRGYDPWPFFPVLTGRIVQSVAVSERFLWDYRRTLVDLFNDNWYGYFREYCHRYGLSTSVECYGNGNFDWQEAGALADIPSSEFWTVEDFGSRNHMGIRCPSSAAHVWGKPIVNAESFTGQPYASKMLGHPYRLKQIGDYAWSLGVNRYVFHGYACQPWQNVEPGMMFGPWGTQIGRTITWWASMGQEWIRYITRSQYLLQRGRPTADVCVFGGETDTPGSGAFFVEEVQPAIPACYDFDFCDRQALLARMSVRDGKIVLPNGVSYRFLLLKSPCSKTVTMTPEVLRKLRELVREGATLIGARPTCSPSLSGYPACDAEIKTLADELWGNCDGVEIKEHRFGKGKVLNGKSFEEIAAAERLAPDFAYASENPKLKLHWIHRRDGDAEIYFVANARPFPADATCEFRVVGRQPEFWYPDTGRIETCLMFKPKDEGTEIPIHFDAKGSLFVVFRKPAMSDPVVAMHAPAVKRADLAIVKAQLHTHHGEFDVTKKLRSLTTDGAVDVDVAQNIGGNYSARDTMSVDYTVDGVAASELYYGFEWTHLPLSDAFDSNISCRVVQTAQGPMALTATSGDYSFSFASGKTKSFHVEVPKAVSVDGPWELRFPPSRGAPEKVALQRLISWTEHAEPGVKYFSGVATYETRLDVPAGLPAADRRVYLDLGRVEVMGQVTLNGKDLGILWKPPFRLDVTDSIRPGANRLAVKVVNLWPNRLVGDEQLPEEAKWRKHQLGGEMLDKWPDWIAKGTPRTSGRIGFSSYKLWFKNDPLPKAGLLGPVTLRTVQQKPLN